MLKRVISRIVSWHYSKEKGYYTPKEEMDNGELLEYEIFNLLRFLPGKKRLLVDLYIPTNRGGTTQVDLVYICRSGIFVIETKNYTSEVYGSKHEKWWKSYYGKRYFKFYSPLYQNRTHINQLMILLRNRYQLKEMVYPETFISLVVFGHGTDLYYKTPRRFKSEELVINRKELLFYLLSIKYWRGRKVLKSREISEIYEILSEYKNADNGIKEEHIRLIKEKYNK